MTTTSATALPAGSWHKLVLHVTIGATTGSADVALDGTQVADLTLTGQNLGSNPINALQLGDNTGGRTYVVDFDDIAVTQTG